MHSTLSPTTNSTQEDDHYIYKIGSTLNKRYKIIKHLGDGTFGRVLEVKNLENK